MENKVLDDERSLKFLKCIKDWGLSHSTLEEVFMKVYLKYNRFFFF